MKQPKKLTRRQKECLSAYRLIPDNWGLIEENESHLKVINKKTGTRKTLDKYKSRRNP